MVCLPVAVDMVKDSDLEDPVVVEEIVVEWVAIFLEMHNTSIIFVADAVESLKIDVANVERVVEL